ncbi:MAG: VacJ family lipoprotein [Parvularculaceae bacterium]|nr:VacJ family lipoprotein [Parvularculaceae bacterium]
MRGWTAIATAAWLAACAAPALAAEPAPATATASETSSGETNVDPWQPFNRHTFKLYLFLDDNVLVPVAKGYRAITTPNARKGLRNFLSNASSPNTLMNDLLQGEAKRGGETLARFVINSTIGFLGFADVAGHLGIPGHDEDFGQTLAVWGVPQGPFLYLPVIGPTTVRDTVGFATDIVAEPLFWIDTSSAQIARTSRFGTTLVAFREPAIDNLQQIRSDSLDYYASLRSFYLQARKREIANGRQTFEDLPDIGSFDDSAEPSQ